MKFDFARFESEQAQHVLDVPANLEALTGDGAHFLAKAEVEEVLPRTAIRIALEDASLSWSCNSSREPISSWSAFQSASVMST